MIKIVVALVIERRWDITHLDIKTTFLHGDLGKEVLMQQLEGFVAPKKNIFSISLRSHCVGLNMHQEHGTRKLTNYSKTSISNVTNLITTCISK